MRLAVQKALFLLALDRLGDAEPVNEVLEVTLAADGTISIERYMQPPI
jgi:hypothetical protein